MPKAAEPPDRDPDKYSTEESTIMTSYHPFRPTPAALAALLLVAVSTIGLQAALAAPSAPLAAAAESQLLAIQTDWAKTNYQTTDDDRKSAEFEALAQRADAFAKANPTRAEPLVWHGIVLSSLAGAKGGLGALKFAKQAREKLEAAMKIDPSALDGSAYTSLGTLYFKVPGFPVGFGDHDKARELLQSALKLNPNGIDPNYFYGEFLYGEKEYADAVKHLNKALAAAPRPNRELADKGRRGEIEALLAKAQARAG
jgi:tetratricopeptide (TPR) repeat protein